MALRDCMSTLRTVQDAIKPPFNIPEHFNKEIVDQFGRWSLELLLFLSSCYDISFVLKRKKKESESE